MTVRLCNRYNFEIVFYQNSRPAITTLNLIVPSSHPSLFLKLGEGQRARDLASLCFGWMDEHSGSLPGESCFSHKAISFHCFQSQNKKKLILKTECVCALGRWGAQNEARALPGRRVPPWVCLGVPEGCQEGEGILPDPPSLGSEHRLPLLPSLSRGTALLCHAFALMA